MESQKELLNKIYTDYRKSGLHNSIDYDKFYLYSLISHSTAIEGSTYTPEQTSSLFETGFVPQGKTLVETYMNSDLKQAYDYAFLCAKAQTEITPGFIKELSSLILKNTGTQMNTPLGSFDASKGEYRLCNVTAGVGGRSYLNYSKIPAKIEELCSVLKKKNAHLKTAADIYGYSFFAHQEIASIHPFLDGNGRLARLLMNYIQVYHSVLPVIIESRKKAEYIESLRKVQTGEDKYAFENFMLSTTLENINQEIETGKKI